MRLRISDQQTKTRETRGTSYGYDAIYQLLQATQGTTTTESYTYDTVGNRLSSLGMSPYQYNSSNELTSTPTTTYTYDKDGELTTKVDATGTTTYNWNTLNRLTSVVLPGSGGTVSFKYDPFGRRIQKRSSGGTTNYLYDAANVLEEVDNSGNVLALYTQGPGVDQPLSEFRSGATSYYDADGLGSITSLTSASGTAAATYAYDAFGNLSASTGTLTNPFRYTSRESDSETGLHFYRARYYDPQIGRFISEDPLRFFSGDVNFYAYVFNSPVNYDDPSGYSCTCTYSQSTGHLRCTDQNGKIVVDVNGYAGYGPGKNNPAAEGVHCVSLTNCVSAGPIPVGTYTMLPSYNGPLGHPQIPLRRKGGRSGGFPANRDPDSFLIHADSTRHPGQASHGCIIVDKAKDRQQILDCGGGTVEVTH